MRTLPTEGSHELIRGSVKRDYLTEVVITRADKRACRVAWIILLAFEAKDWGSNPHRSAISLSD
jgi:hypothetical protein